MQALWERYTDFLLAMGKHLGHYETIQPQIPGDLQFVPQLNHREPLYGGSVVECLSRDPGAVGSVLTGVTALFP